MDALMVPQLAQACCDPKFWVGDPNHDLKRLRLVSKGMREVLQRVLHSYTLQLGDKTQLGNHKVAKFLRSINLLRLKVVFPKLPTGEHGAVC